MADSILRLKVESQEYDNKLKQAANGLTRYVDECRKVGGTLEYVEKETLDYVRALGQMETTSRTATGKLAEMKKAFVEFSAQYKQMTDAEKASPMGKALAASLDQLKGRIQDSKSQLDDINKSINGGGGLKGALDAVAGKFGLSIDQITKFGGVVGVATTAIQVAKDAFFQSESGIDEWGRTVEGAKGAYSVFLDTLNNGNWSNFFQNLQTAIQGGRDLYDVFDRLGSIKSNNAAAIAITQKEIAELRLAKQQGENVDAKLKSATERLAALQKQSVSAGMAAGSQSAFQTIRNGVNSVGGAGINDATIKYAVDRIMKGGQGEFDKYKRNYEILQQKGMVTRTQTINDSQGGTYERQYKVFDINALTKEQQKQYALAKSITEGETRIQKGIAAYAQAVSEGTSAAREEFKGNRYALQGASGSGGGRSGGGKTETVKTEEQLNNEEIQKLTQEYINASQQRQVAIRAEIKVLQDRNAIIKQMKDEALGKSGRLTTPMPFGIMGPMVDVETKLNPMKGIGITQENPFEKYKDIIISIKTPLQALTEEMKNLAEAQALALTPEQWSAYQTQIEEVQKKMGTFKGDGKSTAKEWGGAAQAINAVGSAMQSIEDPAAKVAGTIAQAIATIALTYAKSLEGTFTPWDWIAAAASGAATMISVISSIHSATGYANGGIVKGNSYSGDNIPAMIDGGAGGFAGLNAGEVVLNASMQNTLAQNLQGSGLQNLNVSGEISGETIKIVLNRHLKRSGQGEIVTW